MGFHYTAHDACWGLIGATQREVKGHRRPAGALQELETRMAGEPKDRLCDEWWMNAVLDLSKRRNSLILSSPSGSRAMQHQKWGYEA